MKKFLHLTLLAVFGIMSIPMAAQTVKLNAVGNYNRHDDGDQMTSSYLGYNYEAGKAIFIVENGLYTMTWDGTNLTTPVKEPAVVASEIRGDKDKEVWAANFINMAPNSGAVYVDGQIVTVFSRDESSTVDEELFRVCKWDAKTGALLTNEIMPKSKKLESAGMSYNPVDGKVYGLFYLTGNDLPAEITDDPEYFADQDDDMTDGDAGYAICSIDLKTMDITPITPGLYYQNFITFAINSEGRAFALTSGGSSSQAYDDEGRLRDIEGELTGAQLCEFDLTTGLMKRVPVLAVDDDGEEYTDYEYPVSATGFCSQYKRQAACFAKSNPDKMYWNGYVNSGKGINEYGSWSSLSDKNWRENEKYDTALYEVDINTGLATRLAKIKDRWSFGAMWADGDDCSDGAGMDITGISSVKAAGNNATGASTYDLQGRKAAGTEKGVYIRDGKKVIQF